MQELFYEFNNKGGLKSQLLNIVITNDNNDPSQAQRVAKELIKDSNVLGVIGHAGSVVSPAALPEYKNAGLAMISSSSSSTELSMKNLLIIFNLSQALDYLLNNSLSDCKLSLNIFLTKYTSSLKRS